MTTEQKIAHKKLVANFILNDFKGILNKYKLTIKTVPMHPDALGFLCKGVILGWWDKKYLKDVTEKWIVENLNS